MDPVCFCLGLGLDIFFIFFFFACTVHAYVFNNRNTDWIRYRNEFSFGSCDRFEWKICNCIVNRREKRWRFRKFYRLLNSFNENGIDEWNDWIISKNIRGEKKKKIWKTTKRKFHLMSDVWSLWTFYHVSHINYSRRPWMWKSEDFHWNVGWHRENLCNRRRKDATVCCLLITIQFGRK